jgi:aryl-alcohol dehydrogenase-like predicted oxidoreductase
VAVVSAVLALGAASFGGIGSARRLIGQGESEAEAHALLDCAVALGLGQIDTAGTYGEGASERIIGNWLRARRPGLRDQLRVSSKVGLRGGLGRAHVEASVEQSLARLGVEAIDLLLAHVPDPETPWAEVLQTFDALVTRGVVRQLGVSNVTAADLDALAAASSASSGSRTKLAVVQNQLNLLHQDDLRNGVIAACRRDGLDYAAYSPLAGGLLGGKYALEGAIPADSRVGMRRDLYAQAWTPGNARRVARLKEEAAAREVSPAGLATWWLLRCPLVSSILIGARTPRQLEALVGEARGLPPDEKLWHALAGAGRGDDAEAA